MHQGTLCPALHSDAPHEKGVKHTMQDIPAPRGVTEVAPA